MIQTLVPVPAAAEAHAPGRFGKLLSLTLTMPALLLFAAGLLWAIPGFFGLHWLPLMLSWDALVAALIVADALALPPARAFHVTRTFLDSPVLGRETSVEIAILHTAPGVL